MLRRISRKEKTVLRREKQNLGTVGVGEKRVQGIHNMRNQGAGSLSKDSRV